MRPRSPRRWLATLALAALVATGCDLDEAELIRPGDGVITAEVGQLRVLGYDVDPAADAWIDVLSPDDGVVTEVGTFRETDAALLAEGDTPGDRRRLFEATGRGRTLLVELNCAGGCDGTGPEPPIHVWDFIVGDVDADAAQALDRRDRRVGEFIVIVSDEPEPWEVVTEPGEPETVVFLTALTPARDDGAHVQVFAAVREGTAELREVGVDSTVEIEVIPAS